MRNNSSIIRSRKKSFEFEIGVIEGIDSLHSGSRNNNEIYEPLSPRIGEIHHEQVLLRFNRLRFYRYRKIVGRYSIGTICLTRTAELIYFMKVKGWRDIGEVGHYVLVLTINQYKYILYIPTRLTRQVSTYYFGFCHLTSVP